MGNRALFIVSALAVWAIIGTAAAQTPAPGAKPPSGPIADLTNRVAGYTAWDDDFFYVAVQVNKPTLSARNSAPFSRPLEDDAVIVSIQTDDDHAATKRTAHTYTVAVSAAGGFQLYSGANAAPLFTSLQEFTDRLKDITQNEKDPITQEKKLLALQQMVVKETVVQKGADRVGGGSAPGYTVEIAIPWPDLGGKPAAGTRMGFNIAAQSKAAGSPALQSFSPGVKGASDLENPSLWSHITLNNAPAPSSNANLVSPRLFAQKPVVDGELSAGEWNNLAQFTFGEAAGNLQGPVSLETVLHSRSPLELTLRPPRPVVALPPRSSEPLPVKARRPQKLPQLVMARWEYWFQADTRKAAPALHVTRSDQSSALAHHPLEGTGPWFSFDRADWHRRQLTDMRQAGVDVVLPVYRGAARDRQLYADKGLTVLAAALQSLRQAGQDYPQVGLFLDTDALIQTFGDRPDLREPAVQAALYDLIHDFYRRVPAEFRCTVPMSAENGGHNACPVFLSDARAFKELDGAFAAYLRGRFLRDFGDDLMLVGGPGFREKAALDGYFAPTQEGGLLQFDDHGWIKVATVGAGYDSALLDQLPEKPSHRTDEKYRAALTAAVDKHPDFVLLDGWNDYAMGREIAPSIEIGYGAADLTRVYTRALAGSSKFGVKYLWNDVPDQMIAGAKYVIRARAQNTGVSGWGPQPGAPVTFRVSWRQGDSVVAESNGTQPSEAVLPGQNVALELPVNVGRKDGSPLPEGDYSLCIVPAMAGDNSRNGRDEPLARAMVVPVHVAGQSRAAAWSGTVVRTDMPVMMEAGSGYLVDATLRNDGAATWRKGDRVTLRLYRTVPAAPASSAPVETEVSTADASISLAQDVPTGQETAVHVLLPLVDPAGKPIPAWSQDDLWTYTTRWEVARDASSGGVRPASTADAETGGTSFGPLAVAVGGFDFGVRFVEDRTPTSLPAERKIPVTLSLLNSGPQTWKRDQVRIGYHWYYLDGTELRWEDALTPLSQDVPPGARVNGILANVTAPSTDGTYFLMWDVKFGDMWASSASVTHPFDSMVHEVQVVGDRLIFADLTKSYNLDGISDSEHMTGDFDGQGHSFPAEWMPPYTDAPVTPSAMWLPADAGGPESPRRISFRFGPKDGKLNNYLACRGQRVELGKSSGQCRILHIVAASTEADTATSLKLIFQEPTSQSEDQYAITVSRWDHPPSHGEEVALLARRHYERDGIKPGAVALFHYAIKIQEPRKLVAIILPDMPQIKIAAITLER
jgi:hypothetical protein